MQLFNSFLSFLLRFLYSIIHVETENYGNTKLLRIRRKKVYITNDFKKIEYFTKWTYFPSKNTELGKSNKLFIMQFALEAIK